MTERFPERRGVTADRGFGVPPLFAGYPASPATIERSPRRFVDGEPRFAVEDRSHEKPMFLPPRNAPAER